MNPFAYIAEDPVAIELVIGSLVAVFIVSVGALSWAAVMGVLLLWTSINTRALK